MHNFLHVLSYLITKSHFLSASVYAVGNGAPHHPPRGMHMQRGELLAYNYLHIFLDAVNMISADIKTKSLSELSIGMCLLLILINSILSVCHVHSRCKHGLIVHLGKIFEWSSAS